MITDGIIHSHQGAGDREEWISGILKELNGLDPKELAELLLKLAQTGSDGQLRTEDDMSVLVVRVEREKVVEMPR
jgi:stage II sporulation protein E